MTTVYSNSSVADRSFGLADLKSLLLEPFLVLGVSAFWLLTLPFAAVAMLAVKIWDKCAPSLNRANSAHPLILRRGAASDKMTAPGRVGARKIKT